MKSCIARAAPYNSNRSTVLNHCLNICAKIQIRNSYLLEQLHDHLPAGLRRAFLCKKQPPLIWSWLHSAANGFLWGILKHSIFLILIHVLNETH